MPPFFWTTKALFSHYWRHPWQALFLLSGLVAGVALWSAVQVINAHAQSSYQQADQLLGAQHDYTLEAKYGYISQDEYIQLRRQGWTELLPVIEARVETKTGQLLAIIATDLFALRRGGDYFGLDLASDNQRWLEFIQSPYQAWYSNALAEELGVSNGERLSLNEGELPPALIQNDIEQGWQVLMDIGAAQALLSRTDLNYLVVGKLSDDRLAQLQQSLPERFKLVKNQQVLNLTQITDSLHTNLSAMSLLSFAVGLFIVFNAVRFSLWYRQHTLKNLRLIGVSLHTLALALLLEAVSWSFLATGLGLWIGYGISDLLLPDLRAMLGGLYDAKIGEALLLKPVTVFVAWLMTVIGLLFALAWPMWRRSRQSIMQGSQLSAQWQVDKRARCQLLILGIILGVSAALFYPLIGSVVAGFMLLGLVLFSGAWILPTVLALGLTILGKIIPEERSLLRWMVSDGWAQLPRLRTAMMALLLALTCNLGVESLIDSFRGAFTDWLGQRLTADMYIHEFRPEITAIIKQGKQQAWLRDTHIHYKQTLYWKQRVTTLKGLQVAAPDSQILPFASAVPNARQLWRESVDEKIPWILANEQVHYLGGAQLGEVIKLPSPSGDQPYRIAAFFYDYGNAHYQFYLPREVLMKHWSEAPGIGIAFWLNESYGAGKSDAIGQAERVLMEWGYSPGEWTLQSRLRAEVQSVFDQTFTITLAMNALTLIVAGLALLVSLMAVMQERLPEFAGWSALGVNRHEQRMVTLIPLLLFVVITWFFSILLGALLSWLLIHEINVMSFGWSMPLLWSPRPALVLAGLCLGLVLFSMLVTELRLGKQRQKALAELGGGT